MKTKVNDIRETVAISKWWFARRTDNRWNPTLTQWRPLLGERNRDRHQMRWVDDIKSRASWISKRSAERAK